MFHRRTVPILYHVVMVAASTIVLMSVLPTVVHGRICETVQEYQEVGLFTYYNEDVNRCQFCSAYPDENGRLSYNVCPFGVACQTSPGDKSVGVYAYYDETCTSAMGAPGLGTLGCFVAPNPCRFCHLKGTSHSPHYVTCPFLDDGTRWCTTNDADKANGVDAYFDPTCAAGGSALGCFDDGCRHCKTESKPVVSEHLLDCPWI